MKSSIVIIDRHPGRNSQTIGLARAIGTDPDLIHEPSVGVVGTKGDSQCYLGVMAKVEAIHTELKNHVGKGSNQLKLRLVQPWGHKPLELDAMTTSLDLVFRNAQGDPMAIVLGEAVTDPSGHATLSGPCGRAG